MFGTSQPSFGNAQPSGFGSFTFGAQPQATAGFGQPTNPPSFGQPTNPPSFGLPPNPPTLQSTNVFGQQQQQQQQQPAFGFGATPAPASTSGFAFGSQPSGFGAPGGFGFRGAPSQSTALVPVSFDQGNSQTARNPAHGIQEIYEKLHHKSNASVFVHMMYNKVNPEDVHKFSKPFDLDQTRWAEAQKYNPDPKRFVPCPVRSYDELYARTKVRDKGQKTVDVNLSQIAQEITEMKNHYDVEVPITTEQLTTSHDAQTHKLTQLMSKLALQQLKGTTRLTPQEVALHQEFRKLQQEISQLNNRINEQHHGVRRQSMRDTGSVYSVDGPSMEELFSLLHQAQGELKLLKDTLDKDLHDLHIMNKHLANSANQAPLQIGYT